MRPACEVIGRHFEQLGDRCGCDTRVRDHSKCFDHRSEWKHHEVMSAVGVSTLVCGHSLQQLIWERFDCPD
jgi:hypothetical protein